MESTRTFRILAGILETRAKLSKVNVSKIMSHTQELQKAFTSRNVDAVNNYEVYEQLGDVSVNRFVVRYMYTRFPQLRTAEGVKVVARLRINYVSKDTLFQISERLGFWPCIRATEDELATKKKHLLEDVFEAFIGVTEELTDREIGYGCGNIVVCNIMKSIFDEIPMSLKYSDLYDAKTRLKETIDFNKDKCAKLVYSNSRTPEQGGRVTSSVACIVSHINKRSPIFLGRGTGNIIKDAEQRAAQAAIDYLMDIGISKPVPSFYHDLESS